MAEGPVNVLSRLALLVAFASAGCRTLPPGAECWSLDGRVLSSPPAPDAAAQAEREAQLARAEAEWSATPHARDAAIWYARRLGYLARYRDAIHVLSKRSRITRATRSCCGIVVTAGSRCASSRAPTRT